MPIVFCRRVVMPDMKRVVLRRRALKFSSVRAHTISATTKAVDTLRDKDINTC